MDTDFLLAVIGAITPLSSELQDRFNEIVIEEQFDKKHQLLSQGQTCRRIYFIKSGFARAYFISPSGKECTSWFMGTGHLMISVYSFLRQKPSFECIELLTDCSLQSISYQQLQAIYADFPEGNFIGRIMTENYYLMSEDRAILLHTVTLEARLEKLLEQHPDIFEKANLKQIGSYLGISQETLCRLRARTPILTKINSFPYPSTLS